jgi:hypothetical protein
MGRRIGYRFVKDPHLPWTGEFPYTRLARALAQRGCKPVGPESTAAEIKDSFYELQSGRADPDDRLAWDELRQPSRRLVVDFLLYPMPEPEGAASLDALWALEPPVYLPDPRELANVYPDHAAIPAQQPPPADEPALMRIDTPGTGAVDIGQIDVDVLGVIGGARE